MTQRSQRGEANSGKQRHLGEGKRRGKLKILNVKEREKKTTICVIKTE
jgi:hypothetical protein